MPVVTDLNTLSLICSVCNGATSPMGLFVPAGQPDLKLCFACLFIHALKGSECAFCRAPECGAIVAIQKDQGGIVAPVACCPKCLPDCGEPVSVVMAVSDGRLPISEAGFEQ